MSAAKLIFEKGRTLPAELKQEALQYVDALRARRAEDGKSREWSRFAAEQLTAQYSTADATYDQE